MLLEIFNAVLFCVVLFSIFGGLYLAVVVAAWLFTVAAKVVIWGVITILKIAAILYVLYERYLK
jgi:hypothetical protein